MTWRDGVHLTGTPIWCDARRRRDVCFVSSADRVGRAGHGQLIASPMTLALLDLRGGGDLGVPLHRKFTLGTLRLELVASGRGLGAAALHVEGAGRRVLYAGSIRSEVPTATIELGMEPAGVRACEAVVVSAAYGDERHHFPPLAEAIARTAAWVRAQLAAGRRPVLLVDGALDGLEVAICLAAEGIALAAGRTIREVARRAADHARAHIPASARAMRDFELRAGDANHDLPAGGGIPALAAPGRELRATLWLDGDRAGLAKLLAERPSATAAISGRVLGAPVDTDAAFPWAQAADRAQLLAWIESTTAREVFVTGPFAESIASTLGPRARVIGPPRQMALFPREAS